MKTLVLVRHGESVYNRANIFTGWTDVPLTPEGEQEAIEAGKILLEKGFDFDITYTSVLQRAIKTLWLILEQMDRMWLPEIKTWRLNEKHYGKLQGLNKSEMAAQYGEEQVLLWRRAYDVRPPLLSEDEIADMRKESRYADVDNIQYMLGESLKDTVERVIPLWENQIKYDLLDNKRVLISAHGNSLRGVVKYLDQMSEDEILHFNIPTGIPLVYQLDDNLKPINRYFLADEEKLKAAINKVANQGKAK
jgi:2,3-bisphosphoglycerate-dependent phosphoglycerate mutase